MSKKYELTEEVMEYEGLILHRIRAIKEFGDVKKGDLGGWVESEKNLSQDDNCWVYDNAKVYGDARIWDNAKVRENACVYDSAHLHGDSCIRVDAEVYEYAAIYDLAKVAGTVKVYGNATVSEVANICGNAEIYGYATICGDTHLDGKCNIPFQCTISNTKDVLTIGFIGSRDDTTTFVKTDKGIFVACGCFTGTLEEFEKAVKKTHKGTHHERVYMDAIAFVKRTFS